MNAKPQLLRILLIGMTLYALLSLIGCISTTPQSDIRSPGERLDDKELTRKINNEIYKELGQLRDERIRVTVYQRIALLTGQLSSEERKQMASTAAYRVENVRFVQNEIRTEPVRTVIGRTSDSMLSMMARSKLAEDEGVPNDRLSMVIDKGTIYLIGVVTRSEGSAAAEAVRYIRGVQKVVKVFDYLN